MQNTTERVPAMTSPTPVAAHPSHDVGEERIILRGVSWATCESLLADFVDRNTPHLTYDQGVLEIMAPSFPHGNLNRSLQDVFTTIADEREIDFINAGSTTFKRADLAKGSRLTLVSILLTPSAYARNARFILLLIHLQIWLLKLT